jgi:hypothetical protein
MKDNEFRSMTIREMCEIMDAGKKLEFERGVLCFKDLDDVNGPYVIATIHGHTLRMGRLWTSPCRILEEKPWRPEHGEKVLCRDHGNVTWRCMFYSHSHDNRQWSIGGGDWNILAPFDITKLGTIDSVPVQWKVGE